MPEILTWKWLVSFNTLQTGSYRGLTFSYPDSRPWINIRMHRWSAARSFWHNSHNCHACMYFNHLLIIIFLIYIFHIYSLLIYCLFIYMHVNADIIKYLNAFISDTSSPSSHQSENQSISWNLYTSSFHCSAYTRKRFYNHNKKTWLWLIVFINADSQTNYANTIIRIWSVQFFISRSLLREKK